MDNIKNIVGLIINQWSQEQGCNNNKLQIIWEKIVEPQQKKHCELIGFKNGTLVILVDSPQWLYELNLKKPILVKKLQQEITELKTIYFRVGKSK